MKKSILLIASVMAAGCSISEFDQQTAIQVKELTITASRESDGPETRTVRNESNGAILWTPGDRISLFYGSGADGGSEFTSQGTTNSKVTNFTGTIGVITGGADVSVQDTYFWGLYPYDESASCDGESITMTLSDYQVATPGTFAPNTFPAIGRSPGLNMPFYNICGGLKIQVQKEGLKKVTLHSNDGPIAGKARIVLDGSGVPSVAEIIDGSEDIVLEAPAGEYLVPGKNYYFVIFPHEFKDKYFTLTFESFTEIGTYERKKPFTITRSIFEGFSVAIDGNVTYEQKSGNIPIEDSVFKSYLTENYDTDGDGEISFEEADQVTEIEFDIVNNQRVSLSGIECFVNLEHLSVNTNTINVTRNCIWQDESLEEAIARSKNSINLYYNKLKYHASLVGLLDLTSNKKLKFLSVIGSALLEDICLSECLILEYLDCSYSMSAGDKIIDVSHNPMIETLIIDNCLFSGKLDLTPLPNLKHLSCDSNWFSEIVFGNHPNLEYLSMCWGYLPFESLSLAAFPELKYINVCNPCFSGGTDGRGYYTNGHLKSLDLTNNRKLEELNCSGCNIEEPLDLSNCPLLKEVIAFYNEFDTFILADHPNLKKLYLSGCWHLKELNLLGCPSLDWISTWTCDDLGPIDYSNCTLLKTVFQPPLGSDLSQCSNVEEFSGEPVFLPCFPHLKSYSHWHFSSMDLSANTELESLTIGTTNCTSINLSPLVNLRSLIVGGWSTFETLDISHCPELEDVTFEASEALRIVYVAEGQEIDGITVNRSDEKINPDTQIIIASSTGGNEGSGDHENEP